MPKKIKSSRMELSLKIGNFKMKYKDSKRQLFKKKKKKSTSKAKWKKKR